MTTVLMIKQKENRKALSTQNNTAITGFFLKFPWKAYMYM